MKRRLMALLGAAAVSASVLTPTGASAETDGVWDYHKVAIGGTYQTLVGNFGGDMADDILFYAPGSAPDSLWIGTKFERGTNAFSKVPVTVSGTYRPIVGDFAGDNYDDILWYAPGAAPDPLWISVDSPAIFEKDHRRNVAGTYSPVVLRDYHDGGKDDILWYAPGSRADSLWHFADSPAGTYVAQPHTIDGLFHMVVGDWNADGREDLVMYAPGGAADHRWDSRQSGAFKKTRVSVNGNYKPVVVYHESGDGILWWADGRASEAYWRGNGSSFKDVSVPKIDLIGTPIAGGWDHSYVTVHGSGPAARDVTFVGEPAGGDWYYTSASLAHDQPAGIKPLVGDFDDDEYVDILFYGPGGMRDELWYTVPDDRTTAVPDRRIDDVGVRG